MNNIELNSQEKVHIKGPFVLNGKICLSGFKHCSLPILGASLISPNKTTLNNVPRITDVEVIIRIMKELGFICNYFNNKLIINPPSDYHRHNEFTHSYSDNIHGTCYIIPALFKYTQQIRLPLPWGCNIGNRFPNTIIDVAELYGIKIRIKDNFIYGKHVQNISPNSIDIQDFPESHSLSIMKMTLLFALASGKEIEIRNYPISGEIQELLRFLLELGSEINYNDRNLYLYPPSTFKSIHYNLPPDPLEFLTFGCLTGTNKLNEISFKALPDLDNIKLEISILNNFGIKFDGNKFFLENIDKAKIYLEAPPSYSDYLPLISGVASNSIGHQISLRDNIWPERIEHYFELRKMGATIIQKNDSWEIKGSMLSASKDLMGNSIRSVACLIIASGFCEDKSVIMGAEHLDRGYENFIGKIKKLGGDIWIR